MENISIKGIIIGLIVMVILDTISGISMVLIFAEGFTPEAIETIEGQTNPLIFSLVFGTLSVVVAAYIAAKFGKLAPYKNSIVIGVIGLIAGIFFITSFPMWFNILQFLTVIPAALLGGYFIARKNG